MPRLLSIIALATLLCACGVRNPDSISAPVSAPSSAQIQEVLTALDEFDVDRADALLGGWTEPRGAEWHHLRGRLWTLKGLHDRAVERQATAVSLMPSEAKYHDYHAGAMAERMRDSGFLTRLFLVGDLHDALREAVRLEPDNPEYLFNLLQYHVIAPWPYGDGEKVEELTGQLTAIDPRWGLAASGLLAAKEGRLEVAIDRYIRAWDAGEGVTPIYRPIVYNSFSARKWETILTVLQQRFQTAPDDQFSLYWFGRAAIESSARLDDGREALETLSAMEHIDPRVTSRAEIDWQLGRLHLASGDEVRALDVWNQAVIDHGEDQRFIDSIRRVED